MPSFRHPGQHPASLGEAAGTRPPRAGERLETGPGDAGSRAARLRLTRSSNGGNFRRQQLLRLRRPWKCISGTRRRHRRSHRNPGSTRLPSSGSGLSRPNPQQSAAEAGSPAEQSNLNLRWGDFPHPGPAGVSLAAAALWWPQAAAAHAGGHTGRHTQDRAARKCAHVGRSRAPVHRAARPLVK